MGRPIFIEEKNTKTFNSQFNPSLRSTVISVDASLQESTGLRSLWTTSEYTLFGYPSTTLLQTGSNTSSITIQPSPGQPVTATVPSNPTGEENNLSEERIPCPLDQHPLRALILSQESLSSSVSRSNRRPREEERASTQDDPVVRRVRRYMNQDNNQLNSFESSFEGDFESVLSRNWPRVATTFSNSNAQPNQPSHSSNSQSSNTGTNVVYSNGNNTRRSVITLDNSGNEERVSWNESVFLLY